MIALLVTTLAVTLVLMAGLWAVSLRLANAGIADVFWGAGFAIVAWTARLVTGGVNPSARAWIICALVTIWGGRLAIHLGVRNLGRPEDYRYRAMRERHGARFSVVSLATVFLLQGALLWIVSLPLQAVQGPRVTAPLGWLDAAGVLFWVAGLACEAIADAQLARFRRASPPAGAVMDRGLWRYSRHPNYFGDCLVWWGFGLLALGAGQWWALAGPLVMTVLLVNVSGVKLLESTIADRRPAYRAYAARTSAFVPWPPRRGV